MSIKQILITTTVTIFVVVILTLTVRGTHGNPNAKDLQTSKWRGSGVFELSPERGRYGLLYSLIEDKSFYFSVDIARFILPDLGYKNGHYVSEFAPAVSFIAIPGYLIGKYFGASQVGAFATSSLFGALNLLLIYLIVARLTGKKLAGLIAGFIFLFATPAFAYAVNLYQHHISTFLILMSFYILISWNNFWSFGLIFFLCAMSIPVDYPNLFLMFPVGIAAFLKLFRLDFIKEKVNFKISYVKILSIIFVVLPLLFFMWFSKNSYGNPLQFSGTVGGVHEIDASGNPTTPKKVQFEDVTAFVNPEIQKKTATGFFKSRNMLNGFYIHLISPDRGVIYFAPIIVFGLYGMYLMHKHNNQYLGILAGIVGANLILYSLWGDPWGGWAFGSRYLIPAYGVMSIFIGYALATINRKWILILTMLPILIFSTAINTLGAITTSANAPQTESDALSKLSGKRERYSFDRNWEYLNTSGSKSFVYQTWLGNKISAIQYYYIITGCLVSVQLLLNILLITQRGNKKQ